MGAGRAQDDCGAAECLPPGPLRGMSDARARNVRGDTAVTEYRIGSIMRKDGPTVIPAHPDPQGGGASRRGAGARLGGDHRGRRDGGHPDPEGLLQTRAARQLPQGMVGPRRRYMSRDVVSVDTQDEVIRVAEMFLSHPPQGLSGSRGHERRGTGLSLRRARVPDPHRLTGERPHLSSNSVPL